MKLSPRILTAAAVVIALGVGGALTYQSLTSRHGRSTRDIVWLIIWRIANNVGGNERPRRVG